MTLGALESRLALHLPDPLPRGEPALSSVLALLGWNPETEREEILLTKRTEHVETHKGQVSFPGGFWEETDSDLLQTALRESYEEIGLDSKAVKILGSLEPVTTRGNIVVYPWVGWVDYPYPFTPNPGEVASMLFLPVQELLDTGLKQVNVPISEGFSVESIGIWVSGELVWGATARMLEQLRERLLLVYRPK